MDEDLKHQLSVGMQSLQTSAEKLIAIAERQGANEIDIARFRKRLRECRDNSNVGSV